MLLLFRLGFLLLVFLTLITCAPDAIREVKDEPIKTVANYYYDGSTRIPLVFSDKYFLAVLQKLHVEDNKKIKETLRQSGIQRANIVGNDIYFQARNPQAAGAFVKRLRDLGFELQSFFPAVGKDRSLAFIDNKVVIKLQAGKNPRAFKDYLERSGGKALERYKIGRTYYIIARTQLGSDPFRLANRIHEDGWSILSQPNFKLFSQPLYTPNDERFEDQWQMPLLELPAAWDLTQGSPDIAVAVLDSGFDLDHPDLQDNIVAPYDALRDDSDPEPESERDKHGTPVLGIIAADTDNSVGVAGIGFNLKAVPVKIAVTTSCIIFGDECMITECAAIVRAADHLINTPNLNVAAVNNSYIIFDDDKEACWLEALDDMHQLARDGLGAAVIAGTGNSGSDMQSDFGGFPVKFPMVVGVGELRKNGWVHFDSNFGVFADIVAPGGWLTIDRRGQDGFSEDDYARFSGTSAASPAATAVAGLVASANPDLTGDEIAKVLLHSADLLLDRYEFRPFSSHITGLWHEKTGFGRVNALRAVQMATRSKIPENVYPILYTAEQIGFRILRYLDKEPARAFPDYSELQLGALLSESSALEGEYMARHFRLGENSLLYRAGDTSEMFERLDMASGTGSVVYAQTFGGLKPDQVFIYPGDPSIIIKYHAADGVEKIYQITVDPTNGRIDLEEIQQRILSPGDTVEYAFMEQENMRRIARFSRLRCRLEISKVGQDGTLQSAVASHQFASNSCPELFAIYRGASSYFMYTQTSPFVYTISQLSIDGEIEYQETRSSAFSDTPFDHLAVHHIYEQSRPFFIFWDSRGAIKVKALISEFELNPFAVNIKQFLPPPDPTVPRWRSSTLVQY